MSAWFLDSKLSACFLWCWQLASADVQIILLGNKCDLSDARVISKERGQLLADEYGIKFMEVSAKTSSNVEEVSHIFK